MNGAVCPCRPVPPGSVAPDGGQTGGHHIFTTRRSYSESPLSPSDQHRQHPGACPSVVIEPGLRTSQREGHRPKFKGPRATVGLRPSYRMLRSDSAVPLARQLRGFRELHGDRKERRHPDHQDLQARPPWTAPASLTQQVSLKEKGKGGWTQRGHGETEAEARGTVMSPGHLESRKL